MSSSSNTGDGPPDLREIFPSVDDMGRMALKQSQVVGLNPTTYYDLDPKLIQRFSQSPHEAGEHIWQELHSHGSLVDHREPALSPLATRALTHSQPGANGGTFTHEHYSQPTANKLPGSPLLHRVLQHHHAQSPTHADMRNRATAIHHSPSPSTEATSLNTNCVSSQQLLLSTPLQIDQQRLDGLPQQARKQPPSQPQTSKRGRDATDQEEFDLLNLPKRSRGPLGQVQAVPTAARNTAQPYPTGKSQTESSSLAQQVPFTPKNVHRSPLDYVATPINRGATSSYQLHNKPISARPETNVQQTQNQYIATNQQATHGLLEQTANMARTRWRCDGCRRRRSRCVELQGGGVCVECFARGQQCTYLDLQGPPSNINQVNMGRNQPSPAGYGFVGVQGTPNTADLIQPTTQHSASPGVQMLPGSVSNMEHRHQFSSGGQSHEQSFSLDAESTSMMDTSALPTDDPQALPYHLSEQLKAIPRPQTYYEYTGGMLDNRHPRVSGVCANMNFQSKTFIDAHGATFNGKRSGPYRYKKAENRAQELAIIQAVYQTIADYEIYMGSSPRWTPKTYESYEAQYRQIQYELMDRWLGPPELMPKLRCVEGWHTSHGDHLTPTPAEPDSAEFKFAKCRPETVETLACCHHNRTVWTGRGCIRNNLEEQYWIDRGNDDFAKIEAESVFVSAGNYMEEDWKQRAARLQKLKGKK